MAGGVLGFAPAPAGGVRSFIDYSLVLSIYPGDIAPYIAVRTVGVVLKEGRETASKTTEQIQHAGHRGSIQATPCIVLML